MTTEEIFSLFGRPVVLLKVLRKEKKPTDAAWQNKTLADMTAEYLASLNGETNIGILHGGASGGLCGIEFDDREHAKLFANANPWARDGLFSYAKRGPCFWVFVRGEYPANHDLFDEVGKHIGEWRADRRQTVFSGIHPEGMAYRNSGKHPAELEYSQIVFPPGILTAKPNPEPEPPPEDIHDKLVRTCGPPFIVDDNGVLRALNQSYFIQRFCHDHDVLFEQNENWFYVYRKETGAWVRVMPDVIKKMFKVYWEYLKNDVFDEDQLNTKNTDAFENRMVSGIQAFAGCAGAFKRLERIIHCANGMLHLGIDGKCALMSFSPSYKSRNAISVAFNAEAKAPQFQAILDTLGKDDASLILRYFANILLGGNPAQQILIFVGEGGTSKSTLCEIIECLLGRHNVAELRTQFLHERFEIGRYVGKMLLSGKDVPGSFLQQEGAQALKKLTGHDYMTGEVKFSMATPDIYGDFPALITCNERLLVKLEGDIDISAWERRLMMMINFDKKSKHAEVIPNYAAKLIEEEGEGILVLLVKAAFEHMAELAKKGTFRQTQEQKARVDALLAESQSLLRFAKERIFKDANGPGEATDAILKAYVEYCDDKGWTALEVATAQKQLPDIMLSLFGSHRSNHIVVGKTDKGKDIKVRGYTGVCLLREDGDQQDA